MGKIRRISESEDEVTIETNKDGKLTLDSETSLLKAIQRAEMRIKANHKSEKSFRDFQDNLK